MPPSVLVVVIDGLRASALGAYGNTSFATPALDRFAAESLLFDWCYAPSADLNDDYRALWHSIHPARSNDRPSISLPQTFADRGYATTLITDEPMLNLVTAAADFHRTVLAADAFPASEQNDRANNPSETAFARFFAAATDIVAQPIEDKPQLLWLHTRGMYGGWDAPVSFQRTLLDEADPPPVESSTPPDFVVDPRDDPDAAFRYCCAYAAQIMVLDACWESFLGAMNADAHNPWLVMLLGARGFPLGEHSRIGGVDPRLYADQLHVPWLIRFPGNLGRLARSGILTCHLDVLPTLVDWIDGGAQSGGSAFDGTSILPVASAARTVCRDAILATSASARAIRTAAWCLRSEKAATNDAILSDAAAAPASELFVRPDDRWEANDVAKLCPEIVQELRTAMSDTLQRVGRGEPMPRSLLSGEPAISES